MAPSPDVHTLSVTLLLLEDRILTCRDDESLLAIVADFQTFTCNLECAVGPGRLELSCLQPIARRIRNVVNAFLRQEEECRTLMRASQQASAEVVSDPAVFIDCMSGNSASRDGSKPHSKSSLQNRRTPASKPALPNSPLSSAPPVADTLNATFMRQWLFTHLHDPFPTKEEKERMIDSTNEASRLAGDDRLLAYQQVMLWFINSRRRSGWTTFFRRFAHSDKRTVAELVRILNLEAEGRATEGELEKVLARAHEDARCGGNKKGGRASRLKAAQGYDANKEASEAREMWAKVVDWAKQGAHEKVGDWLDKVLQEALENGRMRKSRSSRGAEGESVRRSKRRRMEHRIKDEDEDEGEEPPLGATAPRAPLRDFSGSSFTSTLSSISSVPSLVADRTVSSSSTSGPCPPPPTMALPIRTSISSCSDESPPTTAQWYTFEASQPISAATLEPTRSFAPSPSSSASSNGESESGWSISQLDPSALVPPYTALDKGKARETHFQQQEEMTFTPAISNPFMDFSFDFSCVPRADTGYALAQTTWVPFMG